MTDCLVWGAAEAVSERVRDRLAAGGRAAVLCTGPPGDAPESAGSATAWIYLAAARGAGASPRLADADRVLGAWRGCAAETLVVVAGAARFEPGWHHPGLAAEEDVPVPRRANRVAAPWRRLEELAAECAARAGGRRVVVLRAVPAPAPGGGDAWSHLFARRFAVTTLGHDPPLQLLAPEELSDAVDAALRAGVRGTFHVAPRGAVPVSRALALAGVRRLPLPATLQAPARALLSRLGAGRSRDEAEYLRYPWTVSGEALRRATGFAPAGTCAAVARGLRRAGSRRQGAGHEAQDGDPWGRDRAAIDALGRTLFRFLHRVFWRVEARGLEHVPRSGPAVLVGLHRGWMPFDAVMVLHLLATRTGRYPRFLVHPGLLKFPFLHDFFLRLGGVLACRRNGDRLLAAGEMLGVLPEGVRGPFRLLRDAYRVGPAWRADFVRFALRHRAPIVPWVTVGSAEAFPILARVDWRWWKRWSEWPFLPVPHTLLPVPLPTRWHTLILPPIDVARQHPPEAADDPKLVRELSERVRAELGAAAERLVARRPSLFYGSVFDDR